MADYTAIDPNTLLPGEPWTSAKALATFENPPAIAEGAEGAPRVEGRALGAVSIGALSLSGAFAVGSIVDLDRHGVIRMEYSIVDFGGNPLQIQYTNDGGGSWGATQNLIASIMTGSGYLRFNLQTGEVYSLTGGVVTHTVPSNCNGFRIGNPGVGAAETRADFYALGGIE